MPESSIWHERKGRVVDLQNLVQFLLKLTIFPIKMINFRGKYHMILK